MRTIKKLFMASLTILLPAVTTWADVVATIGTTEYETLQEAFNAGGTVKLQNDITLSSTVIVPSDKTVTLDLNGKTITCSGNTIHNQKTLTVKDNVGDGKIISTGSFAISVGDNSTTTIGATGSSAKNFFIESVEGAIITGKHTGAKITINSGTLSASDNAVVAGNGSAGFGGNTITIKGGTFNGGITTAGYVACGIYAPNNDTWNISGGTFNITGGAGIVQRAGTVTVSGTAVFNVSGTVTGKVGDSRIVVPCAAVVFDSQANYPGMTEESIAKITGGKFTAESGQKAVAYVANEGDASHIAVSGGSFSSAVPDECAAEGYQAPTTANTDGTYGVTLQYEAKIGSNYYSTFTEAANAATSDNIVVLLAKPASAYTMTSADKTLKVQKNGFSCTVTGYAGYVVKSSTADGVTTYTQEEATFEITKNDNSKSYTNSFSLSQSGVTTIKLLKDYTSTSCPNCGSSMYKNQSVTLDLGGKTLSVNTSVKRNYCISVLHGCTLTIKNGTISMNPTSEIKSNGIYIDGENSKVIIESDAKISASGVSAVTIIGNATLESAGTLSATGSFAIAGNGSTGNGGYTVNITGGSVSSTDEAAIYHPNSGTITISGGCITGSTGIYQKSGTLTVTGGTITGNGVAADYTYNGNGANATGDAIVVDNCGYPGGAPVPTISGGSFISTNADPIASYVRQDDPTQASAADTPVEGFVSGGTFNKQLPVNVIVADKICPSSANSGENFTLTEGSYAATVGDYGYEDFGKAVAAITAEDDIIVLLADVNSDFTLAEGKTLKVKKGTFNLTVVTPTEGDYFLDTAEADGITTYTVTAAENKDYDIAEGENYNLTKDVTVKSATYTRTFGSERVEKYQAWFIPFDYTITTEDISNIDFFSIHMIAHAPAEGEQEDPNKIWIFLNAMNSGDKLTANTPYVIKPKKELTDYEFTTNSATLKAVDATERLSCSTTSDDYKFYGTYSSVKATTEEPFYYVNIKGQISRGTTVTVGPHRWIMKTTAKVLPIGFIEIDDQTTAIQTIHNKDAEVEGYYTLDGVSVQLPVKGIYVVKYANGTTKKITVK